MSSPETLEETPTQLSPEEIQAMIMAGQLDPSMYPEYAQYSPTEGDPYAQPIGEVYPLPSLEAQTIEAAQVAATEQLFKVEANALRIATSETDSAAEATQAAQHDKDVVAAKHAVENAFTGSTTAVEQVAIERAIDVSPIESENKTDIARTAAEGRSPVEVATRVAPVSDVEAAKGYAELEDKPNAQADKLVTRVSKHASRTLNQMGVRVGRKNLKGQIAAAGGGELTDVSKAHHIEQQTVGKDFLESFANNKLRGSRSRRQEAIKVLRETGELRNAAEALSRLKHGGSVSAGTERRVGKRLIRAFSKNA